MLSKRLAALACQVPPHAVVADIGCDHGHLAVALAERGHRVFACDISAPSLAKARRQVEAKGLEDRVELRLGDGLNVLQPGEANCIIMAGMSALTLLGLLESGQAAARHADRILLQPMQGAGQLRLGVGRLGWRLVEEDLVAEAGRFFPILVLQPGEALAMTDLEARWGPHLLAARHPNLAPCIRRQLGSLRRQRRRLLRQDDPGAEPRLRALRQEEKTLEEMLAWLCESEPS